MHCLGIEFRLEVIQFISERRRWTMYGMHCHRQQFFKDLMVDSGSDWNWWVPNCYFKVPISCSFSAEDWANSSLSFLKLMGSGTHCSKIDGFPGTYGTHTSEATDRAKCGRPNVWHTYISSINIKPYLQYLRFHVNLNVFLRPLFTKSLRNEVSSMYISI